MKSDGIFRLKSLKSFLIVASISVLATGCGDDPVGETSSLSGTGVDITGPAAPGGSSTGILLEIGGIPRTEILAGTSYRFRPTVNNPSGLSLSFTAVNLPRWASLNASTGEIFGTPGAGDVGTYGGIVLTASGGGASASTKSFSVQVVAVANGSATLSWAAPTEYTDGQPLTALAGYRIYYGQSRTELTQSVTISNPGLTTYVIENLTPATWYFAASAYDSAGAESALSNIASKTIM